MIKELADKLGTTAEHLWAVLVRQAVIEATTNLVILGSLGVVVVVFAMWTFMQDRDEDWRGIGVVAVLLFSAIAAMVCSNEIPQLMNPEYYAFKQLKP